ncbi:MAG: cohesin domain-containing protein [Acidobacteria bacterium]|nr:cohesin domain-containing protein [Acidobacteriota bacterium]
MPLRRAAVLVALGLAACDSGSGSPTAPTSRPPRGVSFLAGQVGDESIGLRGTVLGAALEVEIYAAGVQDLYGLGFELLFPANLLRYEGVDDGAFPSLEAQESASGQLVVGATHLGSVEGLNGGGTVAIVRFTAFANGSGSLDFSSQEAFDRFGDRLALSWVGGSVEVDL